MRGDFATALHGIHDWVQINEPQSAEFVPVRAASLEFSTLLELERFDELHRATNTLLRKRDAWTPDTDEDRSLVPVRFDYLAGAISRSQYDARLETWLRDSDAIPACYRADWLMAT